MRPLHRDKALNEIGLGGAVPAALVLMSLLPITGLVIGANYALRRNTATRQLGRRLLRFAAALHVFYLLCVCPALAIYALG
ncbi:MAG: hypothetical protein HC915_09945 [Anaerolineae bacterium]|nr:hypothetical protein [Anaerolineae bacterium]